MRKIASLVALALLAACGQKPAEPPKQETPAPAAPSLAKATDSVAYQCEHDLTITAVYGTNKDGKSDVGLVLKGDSWTLEEVPLPAGQKGRRFETVYGLDSLTGKGLVWLVDGDTAKLQEAPWKQISDPAAATTVRTCTRKTENDGPK